MKRQWYYRGSLKFCNYSCSYCPFSKGRFCKQSLLKDKEAFLRFTGQMCLNQCGGAVLVVPYGEALIYPYYWEGLAALSQSGQIDAVGAQSNFSFPVKEMLSVYKDHGGVIEKLRLWGTFHPEMTSVEQFAKQCGLLQDEQVLFCAGAVGVPENLEQIRRLRGLLPDFAYLWINKMDGQKRPYTDTEIAAFMEIDAYFWQELKHYKADCRKCVDSLFVEADGTLRRCNVSRQSFGNLYGDFDSGAKGERTTECKSRECSCYLAYCNRTDGTVPFFSPYPAFRIPVFPKAVFLDIDGTLVPKGEQTVSKEMGERLLRLAKRCDIYLATSLPLQIAKRKLAPVWHIICGGVFASGGRRMVFGRGREGRSFDRVSPIETSWLTRADGQKQAYGYTLHVYRKGTQAYKATLSFRHGKKGIACSKAKRVELIRKLCLPDSCRVLWEDHCMQILGKGTGKLSGILEICREMGYRKKEVAAFGDSIYDREMMDYFSVGKNVAPYSGARSD